MRLPPLLVFLAASWTWAVPYLPQVAARIPASGCRIRLEWNIAPGGSIAPPRTAKGTLEVAEGDRFHFRSPELEVASDGTTMRQWNGSTNQVLLRSVAQVPVADLPSSLLRAALSGSETASSTEKFEGTPALKLALSVAQPPLSKYVRATLWARESDRTPLRLELEDAEGGLVVWKLTSIQPWKPVAKDLELAAHKGAEVVDMR
jgi:hypothetical protein